MVRIKITCREIKIEDENFGRIPTPKNLESMLVNFTLMVLLTINQVGYFYRTRYCVTRLLTVIKFFQSLEQFFLTVGHNILVTKYHFLLLDHAFHSKTLAPSTVAMRSLIFLL